MEEKFCKDCGAKCYSPEGRCTDCMLARPSKKKPKAQEANENIKLTTSFGFTNYEITDEVGIVTSECVCGMNIVRDFFVSMADFFGGRSVETQRALNDARNTCLKELKKEAYDMGADGVMGIDLDYSDFGHKSMLFLVASGTAVKLRPKSEN